MAGKDKDTGVGESPFVMDENGNWILNPKAKVTGLELMAFETIKRSQERGEQVDPLEVLERYRNVVGGGEPDWISHPIKLIQAVRTILPG